MKPFLSRPLLYLVPLLLLVGCRDRQVTYYEVPKEVRSGPTSAASDPMSVPAATEPFHFDAPTNWVEQPVSAMRVASYQVPGANGVAADFSIIALPGPAGGALANVNRWRGQINLPPLSATELAASTAVIKSDHHEFQVFEMISEEPILEGDHRARVIAAILENDGKTWFFKLSGEDTAVAAEKTAFVGLLESFHPHEVP